MKNLNLLIGCGLFVAQANLGCASAPPPRELIDARAAYQHAQYGNAAQLNPAAVHEAHIALDRAERAYKDDQDSAKVRDIAYVAQRKAQLAEVEASTLALEKQKQTMQEMERRRTAETARNATGQLAETREQLEAERGKREAAEKRTREALDKLAMASAVAVKEEPRGTVLTLPGNVLFASGKSELLAGAQNRLGQIADALKDDSEHAILIEGHTDSKGSESSNMELSQRRADSVRMFLVSRGVPGDRVKAQGVGPNRPLADNTSAEGRATNRRVEIVVETIEPK